MPRLLLLLLGLVLAGAARSDPARAQSSPASDSLTFRTALDFALKSAPELERLRLDEEIISARVAQASRGPNPELSLEFEDVSGVQAGLGVMNSTLALQQRIERGGKQSARRALEEARRPLTNFERVVFENELALEVRLRFVDGWVAQARTALTGENLSQAQELIETARLKVLAGGASPVDITRAELFLRQTELQSRRSEQALDLARRQLLYLMGAGAPAFTRFAGALDTLSSSGSSADATGLIDQSPLVAQRASELSLRDASLALARSLGSTDLGVGLGVRHVGAADGFTFVGSLTMELPFRDRNQGGILAATLERGRLASEVDGLKRRVAREVRDLEFRLASAQFAIRTLRREILPLTDRAYHTLRESYRQGRTTYLDVFEARRQYVEARSEELDLLLELNSLHAERLRLLGQISDLAVN